MSTNVFFFFVSDTEILPNYVTEASKVFSLKIDAKSDPRQLLTMFMVKLLILLNFCNESYVFYFTLNDLHAVPLV